jgi:hypothetical protein
VPLRPDKRSPPKRSARGDQAAARIEARVLGVIVVRDLGPSYSSRGDKNNEHGKPRTAPGTCETCGISSEAVRVLSHAVESGNGTMPQFSHPEVGGPGQWAPWRHDDDRDVQRRAEDQGEAALFRAGQAS